MSSGVSTESTDTRLSARRSASSNMTDLSPSVTITAITWPSESRGLQRSETCPEGLVPSPFARDTPTQLDPTSNAKLSPPSSHSRSCHTDQQTTQDRERNEAYARLAHIPYIEDQLAGKTKEQRAKCLRIMAADDDKKYSMTLAWLSAHPEDLDLEWKRPVRWHGRERGEDREAWHLKVSERWMKGRQDALFRMWDWERPVVEPPEPSVGPRDEIEPGCEEQMIPRRKTSVLKKVEGWRRKVHLPRSKRARTTGDVTVEADGGKGKKNRKGGVRLWRTAA